MADELDPRTEARLRDTLRHEAETLPFTLTLANVEAARRARRSPMARLRVPVALLASAAAVVIVVGGLVSWRGAVLPPGGTESASPNPLASELKSYEELAAGIGIINGKVIGQGEELEGAPDAGEVVIGTIAANSYLDYVVDCRGGLIQVGVRLGDTPGGSVGTHCDDAVTTTFNTPGFDVDGAVVWVKADPGTVWRMVVAGLPDGEPSGPPVEPSFPAGLAPYEELAAVALSTREVARAEGSAEPSDAVVEIARLGDLWNLEIALACTGPGPIEIRATGTSDDESGSTFGCGSRAGSTLVTALDTAAERAPDAALVARVPAGTAWRTIVFDHLADVRPIPKAPAEAFPMTDVGAFGGLVLRDDNPTLMSTTPLMPDGATIEVAMGCSGDPSSLVHLVVDGVATDLACHESSVWHTVPDGDGTSELQVSSDGTVWVDIALRAFTQDQAGAKVVVPSATLASADGTSSAPGFTTCLNSFEIPGGASADESCVPTPYVIPEERAVRVRAGDFLELLGDSDWAITDATLTYVSVVGGG